MRWFLLSLGSIMGTQALWTQEANLQLHYFFLEGVHWHYKLNTEHSCL